MQLKVNTHAHYLSLNQHGRCFAIGDIHGHLTALDAVLKQLNLTANDQVIFLGDLIDRGHESKGVIDRIMQLQQQFGTQHIRVIMGNHEEMLLISMQNTHYLKSWLKYGGREMLQSFDLSADLHGLYAFPRKYYDWIKQCEPFIESDDFIFTHASLTPNIPLKQQTADGLRWRFLNAKDSPHCSGKLSICGHSSRENGRPYYQLGQVCIDTHIYGQKGCLTALQLDNFKTFHANQYGETWQGDYAHFLDLWQGFKHQSSSN